MALLTMDVVLDPAEFAQIMSAQTASTQSLALIAQTLGEIRDELRKISAKLAPLPATSVNIYFTTKGTNVPLSLPDSMQDTYSIVGKDAAGLLGAQLAPGQTIEVVSADPATVLVVPDPTPQPVPAGESVPAGTATVASGTVKSAAPPAQPNVPVSVTATVKNADGSVAETISDTVTITPGVATSVGELFGAATPVTP